jgi:hypothetical protein
MVVSLLVEDSTRIRWDELPGYAEAVGDPTEAFSMPSNASLAVAEDLRPGPTQSGLPERV